MQVNGLMHLLFQEVEGRIEEVANSLTNSIKEKDRGASSVNASLSFAKCIHHSNPTSPLCLPLCVCFSAVLAVALEKTPCKVSSNGMYSVKGHCQ